MGPRNSTTEKTKGNPGGLSNGVSSQIGPICLIRLSLVLACLLFLLPLQCVSVSAASGNLRVAINRIEASDIPVVRCFACVTNAKGEPIPGLAKSNFRVAELGRPISSYQFSSASAKGAGTAIVLVMDRSGSMRGQALQSAIAAGKDFIGRLSAEDWVSVIAFSDTIGPETPLSLNHQAAEATLSCLAAGGETRLFDATVRAVEFAAASDAKRKAVLILTDGKDTGSKSHASECITKAKSAGVNLYCIGLGSAVDGGILSGLAEKTGGSVYSVRNPDDLVEIYRDIAALLLHEYILTYQSPLVGGKPYWRNVLVGVNYKGATAESTKQYVISANAVSVPASGGVFVFENPHNLELMFALVGLNLALLIALVARRRGRSI